MQSTEPHQRHAPDERSLRVPVKSVGPVAHQALANQQVRPFATFERCVYVAAPTGQIACIGDASIGDGPLNAVLDVDRDTRRIVQIPALAAIEADLSRAKLWQPLACAIATSGVIGSAWVELRAALDAFPLDEGLSPLLGPLLDTTNPNPLPAPLLARAWPGVIALREWLGANESDCKPVPDPVLTLVGLGPGLTPSGDDVLGGCLVALNTVRRAGLATRLGERIAAARHATGRISQAHLECAADGYGSAALHDLIHALLTNQTDNLRDQLAALDRIGHSSGWDALVGVVLCLPIVE